MKVKLWEDYGWNEGWEMYKGPKRVTIFGRTMDESRGQER